MEANFWQSRWEANQIGFHLAAANPHLIKNIHHLDLKKGSRIFLPLCGKTLDIAWLLSQGYNVVGIELVEMAIVQLFEELKINPQIKEVGKLKLYSAPHLDIFVGDFFDLTKEELGITNAVFDRAALVALPLEMRNRYTAHLMDITENSPQLLITFKYDQTLYSGPPFSIEASEIQTHYEKNKQIESLELPGGIAGKYPTKESVWLINK